MNFDPIGTYIVYSLIGTPLAGTAACICLMLAEFVANRFQRNLSPSAEADASEPTASQFSEIETRVMEARSELRNRRQKKAAARVAVRHNTIAFSANAEQSLNLAA